MAKQFDPQAYLGKGQAQPAQGPSEEDLQKAYEDKLERDTQRLLKLSWERGRKDADSETYVLFGAIKGPDTGAGYGPSITAKPYFKRTNSKFSFVSSDRSQDGATSDLLIYVTPEKHQERAIQLSTSVPEESESENPFIQALYIPELWESAATKGVRMMLEFQYVVDIDELLTDVRPEEDGPRNYYNRELKGYKKYPQRAFDTVKGELSWFRLRPTLMAPQFEGMVLGTGSPLGGKVTAVVKRDVQSF